MSLAYEEIYTELENDLIKIIAKSVKKIDFETNFEHEKMTGMIGLTDEAVRLIGKASGKAADEIERMIKESGTAVLANDEALYKMAYERGIFQIRPLPLTASPAIREIFRAAMVNAETTLNFTNTSARISAQKAYYRAVNRAYMETYTGVKSFDAAVRDAVKDMAERGITQVTYSGTRENGQEWERRDHIDVAVRRNVLTTVNQSNGLLAIERAREWGSNLVEVSRHLGERPSHAEWSGKIYAIDGTQGRYDNLASATGYGTAGGLKGVNCRHTFWAFVEGISTPIDYDKLGYPDKEENARIYEESQEQRRLEREIRAIKREIAALEGLGEDVGAASLRLKRKQAELRAFIDSTGRTRRRNREWISKTELDKLKKGDIIDIAAMKRGNNQMPIPMDNEKFLKIKTAFEKRGGIIQCDKATDKYLDSKMAEGLTYNENTILLKTNASVSAVFEELIHSAQYRQGRNDGTPENRLLMEIEAQKKLIKNQKAYGISDIENEQTKKALTDYYKELENLRKD